MSGRVLVTGGTGAAGGATVKWLRRLGVDVVALARSEPARPLRGVTYLRGDIQDPDAVARAVDGCDAVAHFAWTLSAIQGGEKADAVDIGGTTNLLRAMQDKNCSRIVFASSITVYGAHPEHPQPFKESEPARPAATFHYERNKLRAEKLIAESGLQGVSVRPTVIVGRSAWSAPVQIFRQPVVFTPGSAARMQMVHVDDVGRFCALASLGGPTGLVNLVAEDALTFTEVARIVGRPVINSGTAFSKSIAGLVGRIPNADSIPALLDLFLHYPLGDTQRLREEFGFTCAYSSADAVADMTDWSKSQWTLGMKSIRKPTRLADPVVYPPATTGRDGSAERIVPEEYTGEFDNVTADPLLPEWTAANLAEAFPGPMTPLSLGIAQRVMLSAANLVTKLLGVDPELAHQVSSKQISVIGHRLYNNMTVMHELAKAIPGQTPEGFDNQINGTPLPEGYQTPRLSAREKLAAARTALIAGPQIVGLEREVRDVERRAGRLAGDRPAFDAISDAALLTHFEELIDLLIHGWDIGCVNTFLVGGPITMITHRYGEQAALNVRAGTGTLRSAGLLTGVRELAEMVDADADLRRLITDPSRDAVLAKLRDEFPVFAQRFDRLLAEYGHRGPGETELSNQLYADAPELVFRAVTGSLGAKDRASVPAQHSPLGRALEKVAVKGIERRERSRDANMRIFYEVRLAVREWGRRLAARGSLASPEDIHYLSIDEIYYPPADSRERVTRRRAERERLKNLDYPLHFRQPWVPPDPADAYAADRAITGTPVSSGTVRGRVRIMVDAGDDLEPGEVLVANATDTGWTPFFGCAAAVVTNVGGVMSHAAIVAREFGIPAVVNTVDATRRLTNGQLVEVDGTTGTVSIIEESLDDHANGVS